MSINPTEIISQNPVKRNQIFLIMGLLLLAGGIWLDISWSSRKPDFSLYLINLLPGSFLLLGWKLTPKMHWGFLSLGIVLTLVASLFIVFINLATAVFDSATTPISDVSRYAEIIAKMGDSELTRHFPSSIPQNATNIKFAYLPQFLQGGGHIQLRMTIPSSAVKDLLAEYRQKAKYKFIGGDTSEHANLPGGVPTTYFYTSGTAKNSFPDTYKILVLKAQPGGEPDFEWNHGYSYGVAISLERSEIIYWAEYW